VRFDSRVSPEYNRRLSDFWCYLEEFTLLDGTFLLEVDHNILMTVGNPQGFVLISMSIILIKLHFTVLKN
jgi:hypothetical protein